MKAVMLAAGVGRRLFGDENGELPKALLRFDGQTLLSRHIDFLTEFGVDELVMVVGHRHQDIHDELEKVAPRGFVRTLFNPRYEEGPILSLNTAESVMTSGDDVLFMDADVLYHGDVLGDLLKSATPNCFIYDRDFEPGAEPVKLCLKDGVPVDFGKRIVEDYDSIGEWPGFLKMAPDVAAMVATAAKGFIQRDQIDLTYEEAFCEVMKSLPAGAFGVVDITGMAWIEIDFPEDLERANRQIFPSIRKQFENPLLKAGE